METFDIIIVGAGSAGCVLAERLSADPRTSVLLIEAGPPDTSYFIHMPKGLGKLMQDPKHAWMLPAEPHEGNGGREEIWSRGKMIGGCSSINGMTYVRGQPQDYDEWEAAGNPGWGWSRMFSAYRAIEDHALGDDGVRGVGGPLHLSVHPSRNPVNQALIDAGVALGLPRRTDYNGLEQAGIGPMICNVKDGKRISAAVAFLNPARKRPNLRVLTNTLVQRVLFEGNRAVGVECAPLAERNGPRTTYRAAREVIVSAGAVHSPQLLQLSGIGPEKVLQAAGVPLLVDAPGVGANLREHWMGFVQYRLKQPLSVNHEFTGLRLLKNALQYMLTHRGVMSTGSHEVTGFVPTEPGNPRPDAQIIAAPFSWAMDGQLDKFAFDPEHGVQMMGYPLRSESRGEIGIRTDSAFDAPRIVPNYLSADYDKAVTVRIWRFMRKLFEQDALKPLIAHETYPGPSVQSDAEILDYFRQYGTLGYHSSCTCRMGPDAQSVVDARLRVRGVHGLRVVDTSVFPTMMSGNTNGAAMAGAWLAAGLIAEDLRAEAA
ncbi:MAG: GMC family oxidoreductase N-terminal domain-containing protein [Pseudoxanthomonas sp.]